MTVTTNLEGSKLMVAVEGRLGTTSAGELEKVVKHNIGGITELVFDFEKLDYMASSGLRVLLSAAKVMKKQGSMKIIKVTPAVMDVFVFTGMMDVMDIEAI